MEKAEGRRASAAAAAAAAALRRGALRRAAAAWRAATQRRDVATALRQLAHSIYLAGAFRRWRHAGACWRRARTSANARAAQMAMRVLLEAVAAWRAEAVARGSRLLTRTQP